VALEKIVVYTRGLRRRGVDLKCGVPTRRGAIIEVQGTAKGAPGPLAPASQFEPCLLEISPRWPGVVRAHPAATEAPWQPRREARRSPGERVKHAPGGCPPPRNPKSRQGSRELSREKMVWPAAALDILAGDRRWFPTASAGGWRTGSPTFRGKNASRRPPGPGGRCHQPLMPPSWPLGRRLRAWMVDAWMDGQAVYFCHAFSFSPHESGGTDFPRNTRAPPWTRWGGSLAIRCRRRRTRLPSRFLLRCTSSPRFIDPFGRIRSPQGSKRLLRGHHPASRAAFRRPWPLRITPLFSCLKPGHRRRNHGPISTEVRERTK